VTRLKAAPAFLLAPLVVARLRDTPAKAHWLPEAERTWLVEWLDSARSSVEHAVAIICTQQINLKCVVREY